jgi:hypothetical protein
VHSFVFQGLARLTRKERTEGDNERKIKKIRKEVQKEDCLKTKLYIYFFMWPWLV